MSASHLVAVGRIALVDDDELDRISLVRLLHELGLDVIIDEYTTGQAAAEGLGAHPYDLLFLDYRLPGANGLEILDALVERGISVPTIMLTGEGDEDVAVEAIRRGAHDYLSKSRLDCDVLLSKIPSARRLHAANRRAIEAEAQLHRHIEDLHLAVQARESVLGVVSHDLRGPLNNIGLAMSLLEQGNQEQRKLAISSVRRAVLRAERLIRDLSDLGRISGGVLSIERRRVDVGALVRAAVEDVGPAAQQRDVNVGLEVAEDLGPIDADRDRVIQVLDNLLRNALKFGPRGGKVVVAARNAGAFVEFSVTDEGPGLDASEREHVFDRFWRGTQGRHKQTGSSGLGLAIVKGLVDEHGGRIDVDSEPGQGARFYFTIPSAPSGA